MLWDAVTRTSRWMSGSRFIGSQPTVSPCAGSQPRSDVMLQPSHARSGATQNPPRPSAVATSRNALTASLSAAGDGTHASSCTASRNCALSSGNTLLWDSRQSRSPAGWRQPTLPCASATSQSIATSITASHRRTGATASCPRPSRGAGVSSACGSQPDPNLQAPPRDQCATRCRQSAPPIRPLGSRSHGVCQVWTVHPRPP